MKSCLQTFDAGLRELRGYLDRTEAEDALISLLQRRWEFLEEPERRQILKLRSTNVSRKQYIYAVAIISLYGLLERFVDSLVESYVHKVTRLVTSYDRLPKAIVDRHTFASFELIKAISEDRHRGSLSQSKVIENLHRCLSGSANFEVNGAAFVIHRGNLYLEKITEFLIGVGIETHLRRVSITQDMLEKFQEIYPDRQIRNVADQDLRALFSVIDTLVDRRNEIAHGVISPEDIESIDLLRARCDFLKSYSQALYTVVIQEVLRCTVPHASTVPLGKPIKVFNNSVVCFEIANKRVSLGALLVASTEDTMEPYRFGKIQSLQIDNVAFDEIVTTDPVRFCAKILFRAKDHYDYYLINGDAI